MSEIANSVFNAVTDFAEGNFRNRIFVAPDIPAKKLENARSKFITRREPIVALIDDTLFGSAKDGLAISENYIYSRDLLGEVKSVKISSILSVESQTKKLGSLDIFFGDNLFITLSSIEKENHDFVVGILRVACAASQASSVIAPFAPSNSPAIVSQVSEIDVARPELENSNPSTEKVACVECSVNLPSGAKFCLECGTKVIPKGVCQECKATLPEMAKFCLECGTPVCAPASKPIMVVADNTNLRRELAEWLSAANQEAFIDSDGDLALQITTSAPSFAKDAKAWIAKYDVEINAEEANAGSVGVSAYFDRDDEFSASSPYCSVGQLQKSSYEMSITLQAYVLEELEVHEIILKEGALVIPKLSSSRVNITNLTAKRADDGSYEVDCAIEAYPEHAVYFEVLSAKPEAEASAWARVEEDASQAATNCLYDVKLGQTIYVCFGEYKLFVDGVEASFSGTAHASEDDYQNVPVEQSSVADDEPLDENAGADDVNPHSPVMDMEESEAQATVTVTDLISGCISNCVPDCGWFEGDEPCYFTFPDGTIIKTKQQEISDIDTWIELYDHMEEKLVSDLNGISLADKAVKKYLEEEGNLYHFKYEFSLPTGEVTYELLQFGAGEMAAEHTNASGIRCEELEYWVQKSRSGNWIAVIKGDQEVTNSTNDLNNSVSKDADRIALVWAQYTPDNRNADDLSSEVIDIYEDMINVSESYGITISEPYFVKFLDSFDNSFNGEKSLFEVVPIADISDCDEDASEDEVQQALWVVNFPENYDFSEDFNLEEVSIRLNIPSLSARTNPYAYNLFLIDKKNQKVLFQTWEAGDPCEGQLTDPDDDDFRYEIKNISNFVKSLTGV
jgi:ribosomal protein L40E